MPLRLRIRTKLGYLCRKSLSSTALLHRKRVGGRLEVGGGPGWSSQGGGQVWGAGQVHARQTSMTYIDIWMSPGVVLFMGINV